MENLYEQDGHTETLSSWQASPPPENIICFEGDESAQLKLIAVLNRAVSLYEDNEHDAVLLLKWQRMYDKVEAENTALREENNHLWTRLNQPAKPVKTRRTRKDIRQ